MEYYYGVYAYYYVFKWFSPESILKRRLSAVSSCFIEIKVLVFGHDQVFPPIKKSQNPSKISESVPPCVSFPYRLSSTRTKSVFIRFITIIIHGELRASMQEWLVDER